MFKRMIPLLVLAIAITAVAPIAEASHCLRCAPPQQTCVPALLVPGHAICEWDIQAQSCDLANPCSHGFTAEPIAEDYLIVSVERLDEAPQPDASELRVASLETQQPSVR